MNAELDPREPLGPTDAQIARMRTNVHNVIAAEQGRTRRLRGWTIGGTLGLLVLVAGGTSAAMAAGVLQAPPWLVAGPVPTATHEPVTVTTPAASPTPTPTPTLTQPVVPILSAPQPRFAIGCEQLAPQANRAPILGPGSTTVANANDSLQNMVRNDAGKVNVIDDLSVSAANQLLGELGCDWASADGTVKLAVTIAPLDVANIDPAAAARVAAANPGPAELGAPSALVKEPGSGFTMSFQDSGASVVMEFTATKPDGVAESSPAALNEATSLAVSIRDHLAGSGGTLPPANVSAKPAGRSCADLANGVTAQPGTGRLGAFNGQADSPAYTTPTPDGVLWCDLSHTGASGGTPMQVISSYVPGGAYEFQTIEQLNAGPLKLAPVAGASDPTLAGCATASLSFDGPSCWVEIFRDQAWLDVSVQTSDQATAVAIAQSIQNGITRLAK